VFAERAGQQAVQDLQKEWEKKHADALEAVANEHKTALGNLSATHGSNLSVVRQEMESLKRSLSLSQAEVKAVEAQLASERQERSRREEHFIVEKDGLLREHEVDLRRERERSERAMVDLSERFTAEAKGIKQEFREEKIRLDERHRQLQQEYNALEKRWRDRESRPEDLERIRVLEKEGLEKDQLVQKTKEEMLYFKREMLNREESYNVKFNRSPNVGVMQVLKTKDGDSATQSGKRPPKMGGSSNPQDGSSGRESLSMGVTGGSGHASVGAGLGLGIGVPGGAGTNLNHSSSGSVNGRNGQSVPVPGAARPKR